MIVRTLPLLLLSTLLLAACGGKDQPAPASAPAEATASPAAQTEAVYGDEAPVTIATPPEDDHGHDHEHGDDHSHDDDHGHEHNADGSHKKEDDAHDHGDGSAPHAH
jgi:hypothetical protein